MKLLSHLKSLHLRRSQELPNKFLFRLRRSGVATLVSIVIAGALLLPLSGLWVRGALERSIDAEIGGRFVPTLFQPSFSLQDVHFDWDGKVKLSSGQLNVRYDLISIFLGKGLRVRLSGQNLVATLHGEWATVAAAEQVPLTHFFAELIFRNNQLGEILAVEAESPVFEFHFRESTAVERVHKEIPI
ncbi:MAG: hypothetical protein Q8R76_03710 [Candidatus Omnitrophota bacterium]|nr:hypothetical protein [Candidatus Omnitrophota bacterium]